MLRKGKTLKCIFQNFVKIYGQEGKVFIKNMGRKKKFNYNKKHALSLKKTTFNIYYFLESQIFGYEGQGLKNAHIKQKLLGFHCNKLFIFIIHLGYSTNN